MSDLSTVGSAGADRLNFSAFRRRACRCSFAVGPPPARLGLRPSELTRNAKRVWMSRPAVMPTSPPTPR